MRRIRKFISKDVLVRLYKAYVLPHLEYCIHSPLLLGVGNAETTKIETTNYFILRTILGYSKSVSYDFLLKQAWLISSPWRNVIPIFSYVIMTDACMTRGHLISVSFLRMYRRTYVGLAQGWINLPLIFNLEFMHRSFTFLDSKLWNALPPKFRESQDIASFKLSLKAHMA